MLPFAGPSVKRRSRVCRSRVEPGGRPYILVPDTLLDWAVQSKHDPEKLTVHVPVQWLSVSKLPVSR